MSNFLEQLLNQSRDLYLNFFVETVRSMENSAQIVREAILLNAEGEPIGSGRLQLPSRVDVYDPSNEGQLIHIASDKELSFEQFSFTYLDTEIVINSLSWENVEIDTDLTQPKFDDVLLEWFPSAFNATNQSSENDLCMCIHFTSDPENSKLGSIVEIDLGSASIEVFWELIERIIRMGASAIVIS